MSAEISAKNSKNEILEAYQTLLEKAKETRKADKKAEKEETTKQEVLHIATNHTVDGIVQNVSSLVDSLCSIRINGERQKLRWKELLRNNFFDICCWVSEDLNPTYPTGS